MTCAKVYIIDQS